MRQTLKAIDTLNKLVGIAVAMILGVMSILIIMQIIYRIVGYPLHWSEELARYLMVYLVFLGSSLALRHHRLVAIELLPELVSEVNRKVIRITVMAICIVFFILLLVQGIDILGRVSVQSSAAMGLSMSVPYAAIPIGAVLLIMNAVAVILETIVSDTVPQAKEEGL